MNDAGTEPRSSGLRIAYLIQQFPIPTETFAVSDIAALMAQGHHVSVYTLKPPRRDEAALARTCRVPPRLPVMRPSWAGARSWPALVWRRRASAASLAWSLLSGWRSAPLAVLQALLCIPRILEITDQVASSGSDVVHAFWSRHIGLVLPALEHDGASCLRTAFVGAYDLVADDVILDSTVQAADVLFSHAEANRPFLERKAAANAAIAIVHRGIPLPERCSEAVRDRFRLVTASALVRSKNVEPIIRAFADASPAEPRLTLRIFGDGPDRSRLERLAQQLGCAPAITFGGHLPRDELFLEMQHASIFLLLSKKPSERLPNVIKEALWAGCAVISSRSEGIEELLPDPGIGLVVDPDDSRAVAAALSQLLSESKEMAGRRRERAGAFVASRFSSDSSMRAYTGVWRSQLIRAGRPNRA